MRLDNVDVAVVDGVRLDIFCLRSEKNLLYASLIRLKVSRYKMKLMQYMHLKDNWQIVANVQKSSERLGTSILLASTGS